MEKTTYRNNVHLFLKNLEIPRKLKIELPYYQFLRMYSKEISMLKRCLNPMFIAVLFMTAKKWKQAECPLMDEWTILKRKIFCHCNNMNKHEEHAEQSESDTERQILMISDIFQRNLPGWGGQKNTKFKFERINSRVLFFNMVTVVLTVYCILEHCQDFSWSSYSTMYAYFKMSCCMP